MTEIGVLMGKSRPPVSLVGQQGCEATDAEHRERDECGCGVEACSAVIDQRKPAVEAFQPAVRETVLDRGEDAVAMAAQGELELLERREAAAAGAADRVVEPLGGLCERLADGR